MELKIITVNDTLTHLALVGRLDLQGVQRVELPFTTHVATRGKPAVVDMSGVTFLASLGIRMLMSCAKALKAKGQALVLVNPQPLVREVLKIGGLDAVLPIEDTVASALKKLGVG